METATAVLSINSSAAVTEDLIRSIPAPEPTDSWHPISHGELLDTVFGSMNSVGFEVSNVQYGIGQDRHRMFGVASVPNVRINDQVGATLGFRNSTDKAFAAGVAFGSRVFVCDNLCFSGERVINRKHTSHIMRDLPDLVLDAVGGLVQSAERMAQEFERLGEFTMDDVLADHVIVEAASRDIIPYSGIKYVRAQWNEPAYPDFEPRNAWSLHNAFTEVLKSSTKKRNDAGTDPNFVPARMLKLSRLFEEV